MRRDACGDSTRVRTRRLIARARTRVNRGRRRIDAVCDLSDRDDEDEEEEDGTSSARAASSSSDLRDEEDEDDDGARDRVRERGVDAREGF